MCAVTADHRHLGSTDKILPTRQRLSPSVPLRFPNFERHYELGTAPAYYFEERDCRDWYRDMVSRIIESVEARRYLPVYRLGHGQFILALAGPNGRALAERKGWYRNPIDWLLIQLLATKRDFRSGSPEYGWEEYTRDERPAAYLCFVDSLRRVAEAGILAPAFHRSASYSGFIPGIFDWLDANKIDLNRGNYHHVYSIYALMHGPDRKRLIAGRKVLVVSGLTDEKRSGINRGLTQLGATDVQFLAISPQKSLLECIDLSKLKGSVDLVLVGAGVGSASILVQLEPLGVPCLDVGFSLTTLGSPELRWNRPFCVPDDEFDMERIRFR
jgi:hypothetical protein